MFKNNNDNNMYLEKWGGRGIFLTNIPSVGNLKYDRFNQNVRPKKL